MDDKRDWLHVRVTGSKVCHLDAWTGADEREGLYQGGQAGKEVANHRRIVDPTGNCLKPTQYSK